MIRDLIPETDPRLRELCADAVPGPEAVAIFRDMLDTIDALEASGRWVSVAGIAAPQIGVMVRAIVVRQAGKQVCILNPHITKKSAHRVKSTEGCLSLPGTQVIITRAWSVEVEGVGPNGEPITLVAKGDAACAFQHEIDHLDGKLIDRVNQKAA